MNTGQFPFQSNSTLLMPGNDLGLDAAYAVQDNPNAPVGRDVFGLTLGYYGDDDYEAIDAARWNNAAERPFALVGEPGAGHTLANEHRALYNGNIAHTVHSLSPFAGYPDDPVAPGQVLAMVYKYDQLNRLKQARGIEGLTTTNHWQDVDDDTDPDRYKSAYWYDANGNIDTLARFDRDGNQYDGLGYRYHLDENDRKVRNRLYQVRELADQNDQYANDVSDLPYLDEEIVDQDNDLGTINTANNYRGACPEALRGNEIGNLIKDRNEEIDNILWTVAGKVKAVERPSASTRQPLQFAYGASGQRILKVVGNPDHPTDPTGHRVHYIRDAQGNVMATYRYQRVPVTEPEPGIEASLKLTERPIYGSSRLGLDAYEMELGGDEDPPNPLPDPTGTVRYELTDHLGNVTAVITDEILGVDDDNDQEIEYFQPYLLSAQGYDPFGSLLPGRNYSSDAYRFGFNGMEKDDEMHGATGTSYDFGARLYDARVGRFLSLDPLSRYFASESNFTYAGNNPVFFIDVEGKFKLKVSKAAQQKTGLTEQQLVRTNEVINHIQTYLTSDVGKGALMMLSRQTGVPPETILADAKPGEGPTINVDFSIHSQLNGAAVSRSDYEANQMTFDISIFENFENMTFENDDHKALYYVRTISLILHEYTHLGDRKKNNGNITGDSEFSLGNQSEKSFYKHRGSDTDFSILRYNQSCEFSIDAEGNKNWTLTKSEDRIIKSKMIQEGKWEGTKRIMLDE